MSYHLLVLAQVLTSLKAMIENHPFKAKITKQLVTANEEKNTSLNRKKYAKTFVCPQISHNYAKVTRGH